MPPIPTRMRLTAEDVDGSWAPYLEDTRAQGIQYARSGVPIVDTAVANHLLQASEAAKLMGAQTLAGLGAALPDAATVVDLQEGLAVIELALGFR